MNSLRLVFGCLVASILSGCCITTDHQMRERAGQQPVQFENEWNPSRLETISYTWQRYGIDISFYRSRRDSSWTMTVRDSWDIFDKASGGEEYVWELEKFRCSLEECLHAMDQSLASFRSEKPKAELESMCIEMHVIRELWKCILAEASGTLLKLAGEKHLDRTDTPSEVSDAINQMLQKSPTVASVTALLNSHQVVTYDVFQCNQIIFKDALKGRDWSEVAASPGVGIWLPGMVEFSFTRGSL